MSELQLLLSPKVYDEMKWHALREAPRECVGLLGLRDDLAVRCFPLGNVAANPMVTFDADPVGMMLAYRQIERSGLSLATYHSHPLSEAQLSKSDIKQLWPGFPHAVIGMGSGYVVRAYVVQREGGHREARVAVIHADTAAVA